MRRLNDNLNKRSNQKEKKKKENNLLNLIDNTNGTDIVQKNLSKRFYHNQNNFKSKKKQIKIRYLMQMLAIEKGKHKTANNNKF